MTGIFNNFVTPNHHDSITFVTPPLFFMKKFYDPTAFHAPLFRRKWKPLIGGKTEIAPFKATGTHVLFTDNNICIEPWFLFCSINVCEHRRAHAYFWSVVSVFVCWGHVEYKPGGVVHLKSPVFLVFFNISKCMVLGNLWPSKITVHIHCPYIADHIHVYINAFVIF